MPDDKDVIYGNAGTKAEIIKSLQDFKPEVHFRRFESSQNYNFRDIVPGLSVREPITKAQWNYFRPDESNANDLQKVIAQCVELSNNGIVNSAISLMADLVCQGMQFEHPVKKYSNYLSEWATRVEAKYKSERMIDTLLRTGNCLVHRVSGKIPNKIKTEMYQTSSGSGPAGFVKEEVIGKAEIPIKYTLLNTLYVKNITPEIGQFLGYCIYEMKLPKINSAVKETEVFKKYYNELPAEYQKALSENKNNMILDNNNLRTLFYKKNDWQAWGMPITFPIMEDLKHLNRIKLADSAALDGVISKVRIFNIGDLTTNPPILPTQAGISRLKDILYANAAGGVYDIFWGPDLKLQESKNEDYKFLGIAKYEPVLAEIYAGLGIPSVLTGNAEGGSLNNTFFSLKIFIERLIYLRERLIEFWAYELKLLSQSLGWKRNAQITFKNLIAHDESVEKQLLLELADRGLLPGDTLRQRFGENNVIEKSKIKREQAEIKSGKMPPKAGPYYQPQPEIRLKEIFAQKGVVTPSEVGVELQERKPGEAETLDRNQPKNKATALGTGTIDKKKPVGKNGRPKGKSDTKARIPRKDKPRTKVKKASLDLYAVKTQRLISDVVSEQYISLLKKKNLRQLSNEEVQDLESMKFGIFFSYAPFEEVNKDNILAKISNPPNISQDDIDDYKASIKEYKETFKVDPTLEDLRMIQISVYTNRGNDEYGENNDSD